MAIAHHIILRLADDRVMARNVAERRRLARCVLRVGRGYRLLAFRAADNHIHIEAACGELDARRFAWRAQLSMSRALRLPVSFARPRIKPIVDQAHLRSCFHYVLRQEDRHGLRSDRLFDASNLPDLLGMRLTGNYTCNNVGTLLPRVTKADIAAHLGKLGYGACDDLVVLADLEERRCRGVGASRASWSVGGHRGGASCCRPCGEPPRAELARRQAPSHLAAGGQPAEAAIGAGARGGSRARAAQAARLAACGSTRSGERAGVCE
jgi:hypothetical protein